MAQPHDYVATRKELMRFLQHSLTPIVYTRFTEFYNDSISYSKQHQGRISPQQVFVAFLNEVPNWNASSIENEEAYIKSKLSNLYGIYKALWVATIKVISSVRLGSSHDIQTNLKPLRDFVHEIYKEVAHELVDDPSLFESGLAPNKMRQNRREALAIIAESIPDAFRSLLPIGEIYEAIDEDVEGKQVFEDEEKPKEEPEEKPREDELEQIRREAEMMSSSPLVSPKPSYGSPPKTPDPEPHQEDGGFTSDHSDCGDDDPYLKDLPSDYDSYRRPEPEDDYPDSEDDY